MQAFGYTQETMQFMLLPMVSEVRDPLGSMGNDAALAVMSEKPRMLYDYFKQLFAQVTNPPIDSIREEVIMALECYVGPEANMLEMSQANAHRLRIPHPILTNEEARGAEAHRIIAAGSRAPSTSRSRAVPARPAWSKRSIASAPKRARRSPTA